jgi:hypothetical protein
MENKIPEHLKDVPADNLEILSKIHKHRNSIGFAEDLAELVEESKPKVKTYIVNATEIVSYRIEIKAEDTEKAKQMVVDCNDGTGNKIDWDKCRVDAFNFEIDSVEDNYVTILEHD